MGGAGRAQRRSREHGRGWAAILDASTARALAVATTLAALVIGGCATSRGAEVTAKVETMQKEQSPDKLVARGNAFASVGDWTRAEQYLSAAIDAGADERDVMPMLLRVCMQDRRYRVAIAYAEEYERKHPNDAEMRFVLGTLYAAIGDVPNARVALEDVLKKEPDNAQAHYALASLLRDSKLEPLLMDEHFRVYLKLAPDGEHAEEARASLLKEVP